MVAIFNFSNQPATVSKGQSGAITEKVEEIIIEQGIEISFSTLDHYVRKCAHFLEYMILGFCAFWFVATIKQNRAFFIFILSWLFCILYAVSDEIHQIYVDGRSFEYSDIALDSCGSLIGILGGLLILWAISKPWFRQVRNFLIVGVLAFLVDYILLYVFTEYFHWMYLISAALSFTMYTIVSYLLNMRYVFKGRDDRKKSNEFAAFFGLNLIGLGINVALMWVMVSKVGMHYMIGKIFVEAVVMVWSFVSRKLFIEGKEK